MFQLSERKGDDEMAFMIVLLLKDWVLGGSIWVFSGLLSLIDTKGSNTPSEELMSHSIEQ